MIKGAVIVAGLFLALRYAECAAISFREQIEVNISRFISIPPALIELDKLATRDRTVCLNNPRMANA